MVSKKLTKLCVAFAGSEVRGSTRRSPWRMLATVHRSVCGASNSALSPVSKKLAPFRDARRSLIDHRCTILLLVNETDPTNSTFMSALVRLSLEPLVLT